MTYNEWRDELKSNLLSVSESERKRVLDYYAEAYADRREAGFSEREIIEYFGAPYDAAQRILCADTDYPEAPRHRTNSQRNYVNDYAPPPSPQKKRKDYTWVFVLLCVVFCIPLLMLIIAMVIVSVAVCVAPFAVLTAGIVNAVIGIITAIGGEVVAGFSTIGTGIILIGVSVILIPLFFKLDGLMWKGFKNFFCWLKSLFSGKETV